MLPPRTSSEAWNQQRLISPYRTRPSTPRMPTESYTASDSTSVTTSATHHFASGSVISPLPVTSDIFSPLAQGANYVALSKIKDFALDSVLFDNENETERRKHDRPWFGGSFLHQNAILSTRPTPTSNEQVISDGGNCETEEGFIDLNEVTQTSDSLPMVSDPHALANAPSGRSYREWEGVYHACSVGFTTNQTQSLASFYPHGVLFYRMAIINQATRNSRGSVQYGRVESFCRRLRV